jgi:hypothetical protein
VYGPSAREWKGNWAKRHYCSARCCSLANAAKAAGKSVKACPPRYCVECMGLIPRGPNQPPGRYAERSYCSRKCMPGPRVRPLEERSCTICHAKLERRHYERPNQFLVRKTCSDHCTKVQRSRSHRGGRPNGFLLSPGTSRKPLGYCFSQVVTRPPAEKAAATVEEFIAKHGITKCPTAYAVASTGQITDEEREAHSQRYAELEQQRLANVKRRGVSA